MVLYYVKQKKKHRRIRKNKKKLVRKKRIHPKHILPGLATPLLITLLALGLVFGIKGFLFSRTFALKEIILENESQLSRDEVVSICQKSGEVNIFRLDLVSIKNAITRLHPEIMRVDIERRLPDKLIIKVEKRQAIAILRWQDDFLIDREGYIIGQAIQHNLPVISGLNLSRYQKEVGDRIDALSLIGAMKLLNEYKKLELSENTRLSSIDISSSRNMKFVINGVEVKVRSEDIIKELQRLEQLSREIEITPEKIKYIDLRFGDAIVGPQ